MKLTEAISKRRTYGDRNSASGTYVNAKFGIVEYDLKIDARSFGYDHDKLSEFEEKVYEWLRSFKTDPSSARYAPEWDYHGHDEGIVELRLPLPVHVPIKTVIRKLDSIIESL